jgi:hypothetical protein
MLCTGISKVAFGVHLVLDEMDYFDFKHEQSFEHNGFYQARYAAENTR